ncbi:rubredoxin-like domain-containing protein [Muribaculum gordoncarteri]|uniref:rubredoxin-like domain-containing protein n=1 Tax=Muribaculum gordoncarteri TaxID=2530390 RepID=UPI003F67DDBF
MCADFKCDICGYEVESETNLPDDFVCPICGFDRSHFKRDIIAQSTDSRVELNNY